MQPAAIMNRRYPELAANSEPRDLIGALLDFEALPGRYPLTLREPRALFDSSRAVLLLASGRVVEGLTFDPLDTPVVQRAACFFVRMAMLRPGADHYTMLGVQPGFQKETLRDHYRMLIRLTHPDFAASGGAWPPGAATRINLANDVLSSVVRKAEYDSLRAGGKNPVGLVNPLAAILPRPMQRERPKLWGWAAGGVAGLAALGFAFVQWQGGHDEDFQDAALQLKVSSAVNLPWATYADKENLSPTDPKAKTSSLAAEPTSMELSDQVTKAAQTDRAARSVEAIRLARAAEEGQAAKDTQLAKVSDATQAAKEVLAARAGLAAKDTQAEAVARMLQVAKRAQSTKEAQAIKVPLTTPVSQEAAETQTALLAAALAKPVATALASPTIEPPGRLNLADAQPILNQMIQSMQAGRGDELLRGLDRSVRQSRGAADLVNAYNLLVGNSRAVRLGPVKLRGRPSADQLVVDGVVQLLLQDEGQPPPVRELHLRALFVQRDGQVVLTELSSGGNRP